MVRVGAATSDSYNLIFFGVVLIISSCFLVLFALFAIFGPVLFSAFGYKPTEKNGEGHERDKLKPDDGHGAGELEDHATEDAGCKEGGHAHSDGAASPEASHPPSVAGPIDKGGADSASPAARVRSPSHSSGSQKGAWETPPGEVTLQGEAAQPGHDLEQRPEHCQLSPHPEVGAGAPVGEDENAEPPWGGAHMAEAWSEPASLNVHRGSDS